MGCLNMRTGREGRVWNVWLQNISLIYGKSFICSCWMVADMCDGAVEIPQAGTKHSLNVAVAGGAVLWHLFAGYISEKKAADETV